MVDQSQNEAKALEAGASTRPEKATSPLSPIRLNIIIFGFVFAPSKEEHSRPLTR
jgi:hypothetical protein